MTADYRQGRHRKDRRTRGLCGREGCPTATGDVSYYCAAHAGYHAQNKAENKGKREAQWQTNSNRQGSGSESAGTATDK